jgi:hypothetical protein
VSASSHEAGFVALRLRAMCSQACTQTWATSGRLHFGCNGRLSDLYLNTPATGDRGRTARAGSQHFNTQQHSLLHWNIVHW